MSWRVANEQQQQPEALRDADHAKAAWYQPGHHRVVSERDTRLTPVS
jgi:hypothetical protein